MKQKLNRWHLCLLVLCSLGINNGYGQTLHTNNHAPTQLTNSYNGYLNCASYDYEVTCGCGTPATSGMLKAVTIDDGSGNSYLIVDDGISSPITITLTGAITPDVIIGDDVNNISGSGYANVAVVYAMQNSSATCTTNGNDIYLDVYEFSGVGSSLTYSSSSLGNLISQGQGTTNTYPHIDIVAQYSTVFGYTSPLPLCDVFVIAYADPVQTLSGGCSGTNSAFGVNLYEASLSSPTGGTLVADPYNANATEIPSYVDVAAVERASGDIVAIFTYAEQGNNIQVNEYDFNTTTWGHSDVAFATNVADIYPRIDAIDNKSNNAPGGGNAYYVIADQLTGTSPLATQCISGKNNTTPSPFTIYTLSGWLASPNFYSDLSPVVTYGANQTYTAAYYHVDGNDDFVSQGIGITGIPNTTNYYTINSVLSPIAAGSPKTNAISSTCNNDGSISTSYPPQLFACWNQTSSGTNYVYEKEVGNNTAWKQSPTRVIPLNKDNNWTLWPNPATDYVIVSATSTLNTKSSYIISDISGRELIKEDISTQNQHVNIGELANGVYIFHIYENGAEVKIIKLAKE